MSEEPETNLPAVIQKPGDVELSAKTSAEMVQCQQSLIAWCEGKISRVDAERKDLEAAYKHAVKRKWKSETLKRHAASAAKRVEYYRKIKAALEAGYYIVPNFPVDLFLIRSTKKSPTKVISTGQNWRPDLTETAKPLPAGVGTYQNPEPKAVRDEHKDSTGRIEYTWWADKWDEIEFPLNMTKPHIMEATSEAMTLKIFDEFGILPGASIEREPAKVVSRQDPMILARIIDPRTTTYDRRFITFLIAWHLDTRML